MKRHKLQLSDFRNNMLEYNKIKTENSLRSQNSYALTFKSGAHLGAQSSLLHLATTKVNIFTSDAFPR